MYSQTSTVLYEVQCRKKLYEELLQFCPPGKFFMLFCFVRIFFKINFFEKIISGIPSEYQTDWIQIRPDISSGLIWIQSVCKDYEQKTPVDKKLMVFNYQYAKN